MKETNFKQTELGSIPHDWEVKELKDISSTSSGGTPSRKIKSYFEGSIPWFTTGELCDCLLVDSIENISEAAIKNSSAKIFPSGTLLMAMYGATIGKLGILTNPSATNQACCAIFCENANNIYLFYYLLYNRPRIIEKGFGAAQPNISQSLIQNFTIILPPLVEQRAIGKALSDVDELIDGLKKLIEKKRAIKQGAMSELLSGKRRLPGFNKPWIEVSFKDLGYTYNGLSGKSGKDFGHGKGKYISFINIIYHAAILPFYFESVEIKKGEKQNKVKKNDIIFNTSSETPEEVGMCSCVIEDYPELYLNSFCFGFRLYKEYNNSKFLTYLLRSEVGRNLMSELAQGSTRYNLSKKNFLASTIYIPSDIAEQAAIAAMLTDMDNDIEALEKKLSKYQQIKQGMMSQLLTGKIRLNTP